MPTGTCEIEGCDRALFARQWCGPHYKRWYRHGDPLAVVHRRAPDGATLDERLGYVGWDVVEVVPALGPCWRWRGLVDRSGYGRLWDGSRVIGAHRAAYVAWVGDIPAGHLVRHACDDPPCVNPAHLLTGTDADNATDKVERGRAVLREVVNTTKLTREQVDAIRATSTGRRGEQARMAREHNVSATLISRILRGRR